MERIAVYTMVNRELNRRHFTPAEIARSLKLNPSTISGMMKRTNMDVQRLAQFSSMCEYNFFREIAEILPYVDPTPQKTESAAQIITGLNEHIKELELEVKILRQTLREFVAK